MIEYINLILSSSCFEFVIKFWISLFNVLWYYSDFVVRLWLKLFVEILHERFNDTVF